MGEVPSSRWCKVNPIHEDGGNFMRDFVQASTASAFSYQKWPCSQSPFLDFQRDFQSERQTDEWWHTWCAFEKQTNLLIRKSEYSQTSTHTAQEGLDSPYHRSPCWQSKLWQTETQHHRWHLPCVKSDCQGEPLFLSQEQPGCCCCFPNPLPFSSLLLEINTF